MSLFENPFASATVQNRPGPAAASQDGSIPANAGNPNSNVVPNITTGNDTVSNANQNDTTTGAEGHDELLKFDKLWQDEPEDPNKKVVPDTGFLPNIDPAKLQEYLGTIDFTKSVTPQELADITAGGEKATQTMLSVLNKSLRQNSLMMFNAARKLVETGLNSAQTKFSENIPARVKDIMVENGLSASNLLTRDAAFAPLIDGVRKRYQDRFPKATPSQIEEAVNKYFDNFLETATKRKEAATKKPEVGETGLDTLKRSSGAPDANFEDWFQ